MISDIKMNDRSKEKSFKLIKIVDVSPFSILYDNRKFFIDMLFGFCIEYTKEDLPLVENILKDLKETGRSGYSCRQLILSLNASYISGHLKWLPVIPESIRHPYSPNVFYTLGIKYIDIQ